MSKIEIRSSQLITTFGPGAMVELPEMSAIVGGLNHWQFPATGPKIIEEPRLYNKLANRLKKPGLQFRAPPAFSEDPASPATFVSVIRFPNWFLVQKKNTQLLVLFAEGLSIKIIYPTLNTLKVDVSTV